MSLRAVTALCDKAVEDIKTIRTLINMDMRRIQRVLIAKDGSRPSQEDEELILASIKKRRAIFQARKLS